jgi:GTP cyclohydrolase I
MSDRDEQELAVALRNFLVALGEDPDRDELSDTPRRFIKQMQECLSGYKDDPGDHLKTLASEGYQDLITVSDISFSSMCEHHLAPFFGTVDIAYVPGDKILGLSQFARLTDALSRRLQVQERLTKQLIDLLETHLQPRLLMVRVRAMHLCMTARGVRRPESTAETLSIRGDTTAYAHFVEKF